MINAHLLYDYASTDHAVIQRPKVITPQALKYV